MQLCHITEAVGAMLESPWYRSKDDYLLLIMSLIVFEVLGWYLCPANAQLDVDLRRRLEALPFEMMDRLKR